MNIGLYQSASCLTALERWQDIVSQNITASQETGFRKRAINFSTQAMGVFQADPKRGNISRGEGQEAFFPKLDFGVNFSTGEAFPTKRPLDIAIEGPGFFQVQMPDGSRGVTRAGELRVKPDRTLVTSSGYPILNDAGSIITLLPEGGDLVIGTDGTMSQGANQLGKVSVVRFADNNKLKPLSGSLFKVPEGVDAIPVANPVIMQGQLEGSNVTPLREMVALVQIARAYEANQKVIKSEDDVIGKAIEALG